MKNDGNCEEKMKIEKRGVCKDLGGAHSTVSNNGNSTIQDNCKPSCDTFDSEVSDWGMSESHYTHVLLQPHGGPSMAGARKTREGSATRKITMSRNNITKRNIDTSLVSMSWEIANLYV